MYDSDEQRMSWVEENHESRSINLNDYKYSNLPDGKYTVKVEPSDLLKKLEQTEDPDGTKDHTSGVVQVSHDNPSVTNVNFGYATNYTIKGTIYRDADRSESLEDGEKLYQGVTVDLLDASGNAWPPRPTDVKGAYALHQPGGRHLQGPRAPGRPHRRPRPDRDPDATKDNTSGDITLELNNPIKENVNFGYISDNSIAGTVYRDDNRSGALNPRREGLPRADGAAPRQGRARSLRPPRPTRTAPTPSTTCPTAPTPCGSSRTVP